MGVVTQMAKLAEAVQKLTDMLVHSLEYPSQGGVNSPRYPCSPGDRSCFICGNARHFARECPEFFFKFILRSIPCFVKISRFALYIKTSWLIVPEPWLCTIVNVRQQLINIFHRQTTTCTVSKPLVLVCQLTRQGDSRPNHRKKLDLFRKLLEKKSSCVKTQCAILFY